ncbi:hypothetical protein [Actinokineospora inagensis]|uniref:hypothetical protein n=1 Tax=Actinokineospora inagensis TaxID=103730 RepID=UPI0003FF0260|nr:hypothetical protein [Actinokineospora inagensis]
MSGREWQEALGVVGVFVLLTTVITVAIWQLAASWRARAALSREYAYRAPAESVAATQVANEQALGRLNAQLDDVQARLAKIERVLVDVD